MTPLLVALLGALVGVPLGYVMQRTRLCFNSAYREALLWRNTVLLRMILLAVLIQMIGLALLIQFGVGGITTSIVPYFWLATIVGGFLFGIGMVSASGCSSTVWYRTGAGNLGALVALVAFALGEAATRSGPLRGLREALQGPQVSLESGAPATLPNLLGVSPWWIILPLILLGGWWLLRQQAGSYLDGWDWRWAGLALGLIGTVAWLVAWPTGWRYGLGIVGATGAYVEAVLQGFGTLNWGSYMVLGLPVGAFVAAWQHKELRWQIPRVQTGLRMFVAGILMGSSATIAGGCNIGHGLTGVPTLALSSLTATVFTFLGAWVAIYFAFVRPRRQSSSTRSSQEDR